MPLQHQLHCSSITRVRNSFNKLVEFLFLGRAVDRTLLCPISAIASQPETPTEDTIQQTQQLLYYIATQAESVIAFNASGMKLAAHSDASYLRKLKACSRAGGYFFLSFYSTIPQNNGAVLNIAHIIKMACHWQQNHSWRLYTSWT